MPIAAGYQLPTRQGDDLVLRAPVNVANTLHVTVPTRYDDVNGTGHELEGETIHNAPTIRAGGTTYRPAFVQDPLSDVQDDNNLPGAHRPLRGDLLDTAIWSPGPRARPGLRSP